MRQLDDRRIRIIYIGERFVKSSGSAMSSLYRAVGGGVYDAYDLEKLRRDIEAGEEIVIREATADEILIFEAKLRELKYARD